MTLREAILFLAACRAANPGWTPLDGTAELWHESVLHRHSLADAKSALLACLATHRPWWPNPGDIEATINAQWRDRQLRQPAIDAAAVRQTLPGPEWDATKDELAARKRARAGQPATFAESMHAMAEKLEKHAEQQTGGAT